MEKLLNDFLSKISQSSRNYMTTEWNQKDQILNKVKFDSINESRKSWMTFPKIRVLCEILLKLCSESFEINILFSCWNLQVTLFWRIISVSKERIFVAFFKISFSNIQKQIHFSIWLLQDFPKKNDMKILSLIFTKWFDSILLFLLKQQFEWI